MVLVLEVIKGSEDSNSRSNSKLLNSQRTKEPVQQRKKISDVERVNDG